MIYCFVEEDIQNLSPEDPFLLQVNYARHIGKCCFCSLTSRDIFNENHDPLSVRGKRVLLRCTYDHMLEAISLLEDSGADLVENAADIHSIEHWTQTNIATRKILKTTVSELCHGHFSAEMLEFLKQTDKVFLKSLHKGFSCRVSAANIINQDKRTLNFLMQYDPSDLLIAPLLNIKKDSLGNKEARFIIQNNEILNCSRMLHSVKHSVPKTLRKKAAEIVAELSTKENFPCNYVLDVGEFEDEGATYCDTVEINPLTASLCYVNNSIFTISTPEVEQQRVRLNMGIEYCFDAIHNPSRYHNERHPGVSYEYIHSEHYEFFED